MKFEKCCTCKHAFTTDKDRLYCKKCLADKDDCGEYEMAIEALEQASCEDCISRQAAIEMAYDMSEIDGEHFTKPCMVVNVEDIQKLPPVTPQPKTGHWIKYGAPRCGEQHYQCTSCRYYINFGQWGKLYTKEFKHCPFCGAKMIEPQERKVSDADSD